ncbi:MAG: hypothetical protein A2284_02990 [Deltaproteobacteria bacterium RIFOXYA12_FULL_61_11]|nr:MAG: hypothetical protein A2284_02990 [Deltaproteobacteria bacterium RIFOXYA12_FULL_61_11]
MTKMKQIRQRTYRETGVRRDCRLFFIATEGEKTEPLYFGHKSFQSSRVEVVLCPCEEHRSAPVHVLETLEQKLKKAKCTVTVMTNAGWSSIATVGPKRH